MIAAIPWIYWNYATASIYMALLHHFKKSTWRRILITSVFTGGVIPSHLLFWNIYAWNILLENEVATFNNTTKENTKSEAYIKEDMREKPSP